MLQVESTLRLLATPGTTYLDAVLSAVAHAKRVTLVAAFASPAGLAELRTALDTQLSNPSAVAQVIVGLDRQGFNGISIIEELLEFKLKHGSRVELGVVFETAALMHAKGLLVEGPLGAEVIIGSANLTRRALRTNHELGLHVSGVSTELVRAFHTFVRGLYPQRLDADSAPVILSALGKRDHGSARPPKVSILSQAIENRLASQWKPPLTEPANVFIDNWIARGQLVGQGRRASEVLSIRLPLDNLAERGLIKKLTRGTVGSAGREARTYTYAVDLLPRQQLEDLQKALRRVASIAPRLGLQLSCFGLWMPVDYWPLFEHARDQLFSAQALDWDAICAAAERHRIHLLADGGLESTVRAIVDRLEQRAGLRPQDKAEAHKTLNEYAHAQVEARPPELVAHLVDIRIARQRWAPYESTELPYRQLLVDIVQSLFTSTQRTGRWPRSTRSYAARALLEEAEARLLQDGEDPDDRARELLQYTDIWETGIFDLNDVLDRFRSIVPDDFDFPVPDIEELINTTKPEDEDENDEL